MIGCSVITFGQSQQLIITPQIILPHDSITKVALLNSLNIFLLDKNGKLNDSKVVEKEHYERYKDFFDIFNNVERSKRYNDTLFFKCYLTNVVLQPDKTFKITIAYNGISPDKEVINLLNVSLIAKRAENNLYKFYCLFEENTKNWQSKKIDNITFYYKEQFDIKTATDFEKFNKWIAKKLKRQPLKFKYYNCQDIQEVYSLLGINYDLRRNGEQRSGSFDTDNMVFISGTNSEQYKHDLTHTYFGLLAADSLKNWSAEEGFNIYTTDYWGESSTQIFQYLREYFEKNPTASVIELFNKNITLKYPIPIKYPIAAVIMRKIEREYGFDKVLELILSGENDNGFFIKLKEIANIDKSNFDIIFREEIQKNK